MEYCRLLYEEETTTDFIKVDCRDNVIRLFERVMTKQPCITRTRQCKYCNYKNQHSTMVQPIDPYFILENSLENLEKHLYGLYAHKIITCHNCKKKGAATETFQLREYFAIELEVSYQLYPHIEAELTYIPSQLMLMREKYSLVGVVSFELSL